MSVTWNLPDLPESPLENEKPAIIVEDSSPPGDVENLPKAVSDLHLSAPPPLAVAGPSGAASTSGLKRQPAMYDLSILRSPKRPRANTQLSLRSSPEDPQVLPVWYLKTQHEDLFMASLDFQRLRSRLTPPKYKATVRMLYDDLYLMRYKRHSVPSTNDNCCCPLTDIFRCKRCRNLLTRFRRASLESPARPEPRQVPEHPRALYSVRPISPSSRNSPVLALSVTPRRNRRISLVALSEEPRYRSQSCSF